MGKGRLDKKRILPDLPPTNRKRIQSQLQRYLHDSIANIQLGDRFPDAANFAAPLDCVSKTPIELLRSYKPFHQKHVVYCHSTHPLEHVRGRQRISNRL